MTRASLATAELFLMKIIPPAPAYGFPTVHANTRAPHAIISFASSVHWRPELRTGRLELCLKPHVFQEHDRALRSSRGGGFGFLCDPGAGA